MMDQRTDRLARKKRKKESFSSTAPSNCLVQPRLSEIESHVSMPLVSLIVTNFNYANYIIHAIHSARRQNYEKIECIVIDDCSTDNSVNIIDDYLTTVRDPRLRFIRCNANRGQMAAMKAGFEHSRGVFVNFVDADDILKPDFISTHVMAHLNSARSAAVSASDSIQIDSNGQILEGTFHCLAKDRGPEPSSPIKNYTVPNSGILAIPSHNVPKLSYHAFSYDKTADSELCYIDRSYDGWPVVSCTSLVFRRDVLSMVFPEDVSVARVCADYYLYKLSHAIGGTITIPSAHSYWRFHRENNHSTGFILGGPYHPGPTEKLKRKEVELNRAIATHIIRNTDAWLEVLGPRQFGTLLKRGFFDGCTTGLDTTHRSSQQAPRWTKGKQTFLMNKGKLGNERRRKNMTGKQTDPNT